jgi:Protein of unknown function (DUF1566)
MSEKWRIPYFRTPTLGVSTKMRNLAVRMLSILAIAGMPSVILAGGDTTVAAARRGVAVDLQSWSRAIDNPRARFEVVLSGDGVLDRETQVVWEIRPGDVDGDGDIDFDDALNWEDARTHCADKAVGERKGWRLPSFYELTSLVDPSIQFPGPVLPPGNPFDFIEFASSSYWAATTVATNPSDAWSLSFQNGVLGTNVKTGTRLVWCVRGSAAGPSNY